MVRRLSVYFLCRYYLGDRLLSQGKVWLESAVIEQIGTCFPERFPQQMLSNLSESDELQQEFHLYRLQQLDKSLQDIDEEVGIYREISCFDICTEIHSFNVLMF